MNNIAFERVKYLPRELSPGILYVSEEYGVAGHLCACGCGKKVVTPLGPAEWVFSERGGRPTLHPSIGNWQLPCRSHYIIHGGKIEWAGAWTDAQIAAGRKSEQLRREAYYATLDSKRTVWSRLWKWLRSVFGH